QQNIYINKIDSSYDEKNSDNYILPVPSNVYVENDNERSDDVDDDQWNDDENDHEYEDDSRLLYDGSKITMNKKSTVFFVLSNHYYQNPIFYLVLGKL
ncbi:unnamed protein product, partial [Rotaria socialis]